VTSLEPPRLQDLRARHTDVMQDLLLDILRALASPVIDIRRKTLDLAMELITPRNINEARAGSGSARCDQLRLRDASACARFDRPFDPASALPLLLPTLSTLSTPRWWRC